MEEESGSWIVTTDETNPKTFEFDANYIISDKENVKCYFDIYNHPVLIEESNGTFIYLEYNENTGIISNVYSSKGQTIHFRHKQVSQYEYVIDRTTLADGSYFQYDYNSNSLLTKVIHADGKGNQIVYNYEYNSNNKLTKIIDAEGNPYNLYYDGEKVTKAVYPNNESIEVNIGTSESTFSFKNLYGIIMYSEDYKFDEDGKVTYKKDAYGNISTYEYSGDLLTNAKDIREYHKIENGIVKLYTMEKKQNAKYNSNGNIIEDTDDEGNVITYEYSQSGVNANFPTLMTTTNVSGVIISKIGYKYDEKGNIQQETDYINKLVTKYQYDSDGNVTQVKETLVSDSTSLDNIDSASLAKGLNVSSEINTYDEDGNIKTSNIASGTVTDNETNTYDIVGRLVKSVNKKGIETTYRYDGFGRVIEMTRHYTNGTPEMVTGKYDLNGLLIEQTDKVGRAFKYEYDKMGRMTKRNISYGDESYTYTIHYGHEHVSIHTGTGEKQTFKFVKTVIVADAEGKFVSETYKNDLGQTIRELKNGIITDYTYDKQGNVFTEYTDGVNGNEGKLSVKIYDVNGRLTDTIQNPVYVNGEFTVDEQKSIVTSNVYDSAGNLIKTIDGRGNKKEYEYDKNGRLKKVILDDGTGTANYAAYAYDIQTKDASGKIISTLDRTTNAMGNVSETVYNGAGQMMSVEDKSSSGSIKTTYEYDANGNIIKKKLSNGCSIEYIYNIKDILITSKEYSQEGVWVKKTDYAYNQEDILIQSVDYNVTNEIAVPYHYTIYEYDILKRMTGYAEITANSKPSAETIKKHKITYVYDVQDKLIKILYPRNSGDKLKGIVFEYNYSNWLVNIKGIVDVDGTEEVRLIRSYEYYIDSKVKTIKDYRGFLEGSEGYILKTYEYDVFDRVTQMIYTDSNNLDEVLEMYQYTYDNNNNIVCEGIQRFYSHMYNGNTYEKRKYEYDNLNQLIGTKRYIAGTLVDSSSYSYDKLGNRIQTIKGKSTVVEYYDELNRLYHSDIYKEGRDLGAKLFHYDLSGNQITVSDYSKDEVTYNKYDALNQLIETVVKNGETVLYTQKNEYNNQGQRISKTDNGITTYYYYQGSVVLYTTDKEGNKTSQNIISPDGEIIATIRYESDGQHDYFYNKDIRKSITEIIDKDGNNVVAYKYDDDGITEKFESRPFYNEICYTSGIYDELTGRYYLNARHYNPEDARFLTQDSYRGEKADYKTWNLYAYCAGNPTTYTDPSGQVALELLTGYGAANAWNVTGWAALGGAAIVGGIYVVDYTYKHRDEIADVANNIVVNAKKEINAIAKPSTNKKSNPIVKPSAKKQSKVKHKVKSNTTYSKGGHQNIKDSGYTGVSDQALEEMYKNPNVSKREKQRIKKEQKARKQRNKRKRR